MGTSRRKFTSEFKKKVVLEALKERSSIQEIAAKYEIHPQQITDWKRHFVENSDLVFDRANKADQDTTDQQKLIELLYSQIGQLKVENDFLKKKLS
jgi:transposase